MKLSFKTFKKRCQNKMKQNHRVWDNFWLQNSALGSPRQVPKPPLAAPRESKGVSRQPLSVLFGSPGTPREPLAPSRHCLGASKSYLGSLGTKHFVLGGLGTPNFIKNQEFVSHAFDTYFPYSPSPTASETSG